ncbi:hypothetical protein BKA65DRAFT_485371 [Rhexocercosporidium sp. MPI-PUGE-AT-0058]|nr:hypothetical protein BKA65DRAFT_485371 [Rhexocercosporidium sp. MPI-PUGE-AT-0058]
MNIEKEGDGFENLPVLTGKIEHNISQQTPLKQNSDFPEQPKPYKKSHAIFVRWENATDIPIEGEFNSLGKRLIADFDFEVKQYLLQDTKTSEALTGEVISSIGNYVSKLSREDLVLFYYNGHGMRHKVQGQSSLLLHSHTKGGLGVFWTHIKTALRYATCDVVVILDCCYSGEPQKVDLTDALETQVDEGKKMNIIAACGSTQTTLAGRHSFTNRLIICLEDLVKLKKPIHVEHDLNELIKKEVEDYISVSGVWLPQSNHLTGGDIVLFPKEKNAVAGGSGKSFG